jgi:hypothetical protein
MKNETIAMIAFEMKIPPTPIRSLAEVSQAPSAPI